MVYVINARINNTDNTQMLATLNDINTNYGASVRSVQALGKNKDITLVIEETLYNNMLTTITALILEYDDTVDVGRMQDWSIDFRDS